MLQVQRLNGYYGPICGLESVSFELPKGGCLAVCGINGAGKTTLFRRLAGWQPPNGSGHIRFCGQEISHLEASGRAALGVCLVPEGRQLFDRLTVEQNLCMGAYLSSGQTTDLRLKALYQQYPLAKAWRRRKAGQLSGGQQQLVAIWRGLMADPKVLLVDEPLMGLSPIMQQQVLGDLANLPKRGITLLYTCQDLEHQLFLASHALVLQCGRQTYFGAAKGVTALRL